MAQKQIRTVSLESEVAEKVATEAARENRSLSNYVNTRFKEFFGISPAPSKRQRQPEPAAK